MLSVLAGHKRYAHVTALRGDGVSPQVLEMRRIVSEDALRRALGRIDEETGAAWMRRHLMRSITPALSEPWILDVDTTIKTLYGRQEGAEVGYNPRKPGRPSHAYHSYWVGNLRLVLDVEVSGGKAYTGSHALPGLSRLLEELPPEHRPFLVRGDCGFGNDTVLREMEARQQRYLFKLKQSKNVRRLLVRQFQRHDWVDAGQGWEAVEMRSSLPAGRGPVASSSCAVP
jgi:Transposase DDE domain group 1